MTIETILNAVDAAIAYKQALPTNELTNDRKVKIVLEYLAGYTEYDDPEFSAKLKELLES